MSRREHSSRRATRIAGGRATLEARGRGADDTGVPLLPRRVAQPRGLHVPFTVQSDRDRRNLIAQLVSGLTELDRRSR